ncbi:MAG: GerMN domain-containing protein [Armatimonadota bacterium]
MGASRGSLLVLGAPVCVLLAVAGCQRPRVTPPPTPSPPSPRTETKVVKVYFADPETALLRAVERTVAADTPATGAMLSLLEGPREGEELVSPLPEGTGLRGVSVEEGLATVDLTAEFGEGFPPGAAASLAALYSVVNTLTELEEVEAVDILVEGQAVDVLGEISVAEPLTRNEDLIAPEGA